MSDETLIFGINPVLSLLQEGQRPVEALFALREEGRRLRQILELARDKGVLVRLVDRIALDRLVKGGVHQGVAARVTPRRQPDWDEILERLEKHRDGILVILDGVEDPRNLGAVLRSAEAFGAMAVVLPKDRTAPLSGVAVKASAGAAERLDLVRVTNLARSLDQLREVGYWVIGLDGEASQSIGETNLKGGIALVLGGEGKGLRRLTREKCDTLAAIPMVGQTGSFNLSVAAAIALYECRRQRG
ncbi:MAG: 23S rRNA (guanosine(2251)-2'-O)-methyltransferase RlmB [Magnetococcales bacterium]|nr:23S rRNA (guanosine(2251)-2'-O)-methyltransferase RlmB [Magnetococcales bacterium]NGZ26778.1 23S rRNA (guanosine(2251)-2'-O)-methyltransferase RlmB [Magnetococcales bacterium]